jgi:inorganic pyrophosphatase
MGTSIGEHRLPNRNTEQVTTKTWRFAERIHVARNDRIIAIEKDAHSWADIKTIDDLGKEFCRELEEFFVNYHRLSGKEFRVLGLKGPDQARTLVKAGMR